MAVRAARLVDLSAEVMSFRDAVIRGLSQPRKAIPPMYFYDARGSELFEAICDLPEYYPTRIELGILERCAADMAERIGPAAQIVEYGSGSSRKARLLLNALREPVAYMPVDISADHLKATAETLAHDYPSLEVTAVAADYTRTFALPKPKRAPQALVGLFTGSTIGNFEPGEALSFLRQTARQLAGGGMLLIGTDLRKEPRRLHAAYNDAAGVTAAFNLNLLARINRELGGDFDVEAFDHYAFYNPHAHRIEMHLVSCRDQTVRIAGRSFHFNAGESIHTENSYKFDVDEFHATARDAGFLAEGLWIDEERLFGVHLLRAR